MKRSKMLNIMMESFCKEIPYHDDGGIQLQRKLVRLLEDMEEAGMLPPEWLYKEYKESGFSTEEETLIYEYFHKRRAWEPEEEENEKK